MNKCWCEHEDCGEPVWILYFAPFGDDEEICEIRQDDDGDWIINSALLGMEKAVKDYIYSQKENIIERCVERATAELVRKGVPKLIESLKGDK